MFGQQELQLNRVLHLANRDERSDDRVEDRMGESTGKAVQFVVLPVQQLNFVKAPNPALPLVFRLLGQQQAILVFLQRQSIILARCPQTAKMPLLSSTPANTRGETLTISSCLLLQ